VATRFYFRENSAAPVSVTVDAAWEDSASPFATGTMFLTTDGADTLTTITGFTSTTGQDRCHRQWVSEEMAAGKVFNTSVTYKCQVMVRESAANDNLVDRIGVRIVSSDGTTVRHTILAVNAYVAGEYPATLINNTFLDGDAGAGSYTTVTGDRLVVEIGHNDASGATIEGRSRWGSAGASDYPEDESTTDIALNPWFEVSLDGLFTGGTDHTAGPTDTLALTDAVAKARGLGAADTLALADARAHARGLGRADALALADSLTAAKTIPLAINDTLTLSDAASPAAAKAKAVADTVALTDAQAKARGLAVTDTLALTDSSARVKAIPKAVDDTLTLADARALGRGLAQADNLTLADSATPNLFTAGTDHTRQVDDTVALSDARAFSRGLTRTEALSLADNFTRLAVYQRTPADTLALADLLARVHAASRTFTDAVTLSDLLSPEVPGEVDVDDIVLLTDELTHMLRREPIAAGHIEYALTGSVPENGTGRIAGGANARITEAEGGMVAR
jgi:hypothetical protein